MIKGLRWTPNGEPTSNPILLKISKPQPLIRPHPGDADAGPSSPAQTKMSHLEAVAAQDASPTAKNWRRNRHSICDAEPRRAAPVPGKTIVADREGFEPSVTLLPHTLSKRAHSTTLTPALGRKGAHPTEPPPAWQANLSKLPLTGLFQWFAPACQPVTRWTRCRPHRGHIVSRVASSDRDTIGPLSPISLIINILHMPRTSLA